MSNETESAAAVGSSELVSRTVESPKPSPRDMLAMWRAREAAMRTDEASARKDANALGLDKWFEGQADALSRCADELEYIILPQLETASAAND